MKKTLKSYFLLSVIGLGFIITLTSPMVFVSAATDRADHPVANVLLLTNNTIDDQNALWVSLGLDNKINTTTYLNPLAETGNATSDLTSLNFDFIDAVIVDSYLPEGAELEFLIEHINGTQAETGLIFFGGNYTESSIYAVDDLLPIEFLVQKPELNATIYELYQNQTGLPSIPGGGYFDYVYDITDPYEVQSNEIQVAVSDAQDSLSPDDKSIYVKRIAWQSCPLLYERIFTYYTKIDEGAKTLIEVPNTLEPLVSKWEYNGDPDIEVLYCSPGTADLWNHEDEALEEWNTPFHLWPYFNYMVYLMVFDVSNLAELPDENIETYAEWPHSPIPHDREATIWMIFVAALWVFNFLLFFTLGKKKNERIENLDTESNEGEKEQVEQPEEPIVDKSGESEKES